MLASEALGCLGMVSFLSLYVEVGTWKQTSSLLRIAASSISYHEKFGVVLID